MVNYDGKLIFRLINDNKAEATGMSTGVITL